MADQLDTGALLALDGMQRDMAIRGLGGEIAIWEARCSAAQLSWRRPSPRGYSGVMVGAQRLMLSG